MDMINKHFKFGKSILKCSDVIALSVQIWRMSDLIYRPEEEVLAELEKFKSHVVSCTSKA